MTALYQVGHLARLPLGTTYPNVVTHVGHLLARFSGAELAIDLTGVGRPVFDMFVYNQISPTGVNITAGTAQTREGNVCSVPKLTLVSRLQALLHQGLLKILRVLPEAETLIRELSDFRVQYTAAGNMAFNARSGRHDDLVLALAIAIWRAEGGSIPSWGIFEATRIKATGVATTMFIGVDLGQSRDPTAIAIVRKVDHPTAEDFVSMPVAAPPAMVYAPGSVEAARTSAKVAPTAPWAQKHNELLNRETPDHPESKSREAEFINGPSAKTTYAPGSVEWAAAQARKASG
jgi:hypothetical protein